jgi:hypothetical protein
MTASYNDHFLAKTITRFLLESEGFEDIKYHSKSTVTLRGRAITVVEIKKTYKHNN